MIANGFKTIDGYRIFDQVPHACLPDMVLGVMIILQWYSYPMTIPGYQWYQSQPVESWFRISSRLVLQDSRVDIVILLCLREHRWTEYDELGERIQILESWNDDIFQAIHWIPFCLHAFIQYRQFQRLHRLGTIWDCPVLRIFCHDPLPLPCDGAIWKRRRD